MLSDEDNQDDEDMMSESELKEDRGDHEERLKE